MMAHKICYLSRIERNKRKKEINQKYFFLLLISFCHWWLLWRRKIQPHTVVIYWYLLVFFLWKIANHGTYRYASCCCKHVDAFSAPLTGYNFKNLFCHPAFLLEASKQLCIENGYNTYFCKHYFFFAFFVDKQVLINCFFGISFIFHAIR